jgi:tRNA/tmRNA/rRNA uracil-C5-methylase (TrmA/RlmC/RlmD family)
LSRATSRARQRKVRGRSLVGERYDVRPDRVAHGGFVVARHEGVVVFVRHALPGERVVVEVTEGQEGDRFLRADAVEVLEPSPHRVTPPCPFARPGRCGGCDFQHVSLPFQRELKAAVVREQLHRLAGLEVDVVVEPVAGDVGGLDWRTRVQWAIAPDGTPGLRKHRSHDVVPIDLCRIAHPGLPPVTDSEWPDAASVEALVSSTGEQLRLVTTRDDATFADGPHVLHEQALGRPWRVTGSGFWQVHPGAAEALATAVLEGLDPQPGERAADLYSGVGLFSAALAARVGPSGRVFAVEADAAAVQDATANLADLPQVESLADRVDRALRRGAVGPVDVVVLDPPRTGAKRGVVSGIAATSPRLRAFDLFPMTQHVECVAILARHRVS